MTKHEHHIPDDLSLLQRRRLSWAVAKGSPLGEGRETGGHGGAVGQGACGES